MQKESIFKGLTVLELASALAGPSVGMFFAELGARVIKVENKTTDGDVTRRWRHPKESTETPLSTYYHCVNWKKEVLMLDLSQEADRNRVYALVKEADVVVSNFKFGSAVKLGVDYDTLSKINDKIVHGSIYAYDEDDSRPGFDAVLQAETGWMSMNGYPDGLPTKVPLPIIDILAGHQLKEGILVALLQKEKTGKGCHVSASLYDSSVSAMTNQASTYLNLGIVPQRIGSQHPSIAPYGDVVSTSDGVAYLLGVGTQDHFNSLCDALDVVELETDPRFLSNQLRLENRAILVSKLRDAASGMTAAVFESRCNQHGVPLGPIRNLAQVFAEADGQEMILEEQHEDGSVSKRVKTCVFKILGD
ncbi:MAG: CoA transferase [Bacteroidia bacterium]|nr:CoA transferase [Bacteroidia bacterium]